MPQRTVQFLFDYNSPYAYIASMQLEAICEPYGAKIHWDPIVLGGIFKEDQTTPGVMIDKRRIYMLQDLKNLSEVYGFPYKERTTFLFNPILALRATLQVEQGEKRARVVHSLFSGAFAKDMDLGDPKVVCQLLDEAGCDGAALIEGAEQQAVKDALKQNTQAALAAGVFGAPMCILDDGKMFWGHDRLKVLDYFLEKSEKG